MAKPSSLAREPSDRRERVRKARRFALKILKGSDAGVFVCHTPRRAARIAAACRMIGRHDRLEKEALAGVEIAAWLHELGFVQTPHKPVEGSLVLAKAFLEIVPLCAGKRRNHFGLHPGCPQRKTAPVARGGSAL